MLRALRHPGYRAYSAAQIVSLMGTWMQNVAQSWLIYRLTGSALGLGIVAFASQIPLFLLGPVAGLLADRFPKRIVLSVVQSLFALLAGLLAVLTFAEWVTPTHVTVLALCYGLVSAFDVPTRQSLVLEMVGREDLPNAIAINSSIFNAARIVGPALGGIVVATVGEGPCFLINALSYLGTIAVLLRLKLVAVAPPPHGGSFLRQIAAGFAFVAGAKRLRAVFLLVGVISVAVLPYMVLLPLFADRVLGLGADGLGGLTGASGGGALLGALVLASRPPSFDFESLIGVATVAGGMMLIVFAMSTELWLSFGALLLVGFCMMTQLGASNTFVQMNIPEGMRGRIMGIYSMVFLGLSPMGALSAGALSERIGETRTIALGGSMAVLGGLSFVVARIVARGRDTP